MTDFEAKMTNFDRKWPILTKNDRFCIENNRFWSKMADFDQKWPILNLELPILIENDFSMALY